MPMDDQLTYCLDCETEITISATKCPHCGAKSTQSAPRTMGCLGIFFLLAALGLFYDSKPWAGIGTASITMFLFVSMWFMSKKIEKKIEKIKKKKGH